MSARQVPLDVQVEPLAGAPAVEFVLHATTAATDDAKDWKAAPGHASPAGGEGGLRLHFAPRRWLVVGGDAATLEQLRALERRGAGVVVDVEGKWQAMRIAGRDATRALSATIDVSGVLAGRGCAAVTLFDGPAIVMRDGTGFRVWVAASCAQAFREALERLAA